VEYFRYLKVEANKYIFQDGDYSKNFYGILRGRVSIRHRKKEPDVIKWEGMENTSNNIREKISLMSKMTILSLNYEEDSNKPNRKDSQESLKSNPQMLSFRRQVNSNLAKSSLQASFLGRMSEKMRKKIANIEEIEVEILNTCTSFGEINSLNNVPIRGSALAVETCHLVVLDRANFERTALSKMLNKIDMERKALINATFPILYHLAQHKLEEFYKCFDTVYLRRNQIVFNEQEPIENVYIVLKGECVIKKDIHKSYISYKNLHPKNYDNYQIKKDFSLHGVKEQVYSYADNELIKNKNVKSVLTLVKGNIAGVELSAGLQNYNHTLIVSSEQAVLLLVNKNKLIDLRIGLIESFFNLFIENESLIEKNVSALNQITDKMKINYRSASYSISEYKEKKFNKSNKNEEENKVSKFIDQIRNNKIKNLSNRLDLKTSFLSNTFKPIHKKIISHDGFSIKNFFKKETDQNLVNKLVVSDIKTNDSFIKSKFKKKLLIPEKNSSQQNTARTAARSNSNGGNHTESNNKRNNCHLTRNIDSILDNKDFSLFTNKIKNFSRFTDEENKIILKYDSGNYDLPLLAINNSADSKKMKLNI
jgi:CRP-like cAMP-binding protein